MDLFARINAIYNSYFGPSPPTRACVACPLPKGCHVKMDVLASRSSPDLARIALHVRGLSYWAPANIGPYSQAVKVNERLFIAGQIGLIPAYLTLPEPASFALEAALSFQHARRIIKAVQEGTGGGFKGCMDSCICWVSGPPLSFRPKMKAVRKAWAEWRSMSPAYMRPDIPLLIVQVTSLPKGAQVEWQATWTTGRAATEEEDHDNKSGIGTARACWSTGHDDWPTHSLASGSTIAKFITVPHFAPISLHASRNEDDEKSFYSVRAFHKVSIPEHLGKSVRSATLLERSGVDFRDSSIFQSPSDGIVSIWVKRIDYDCACSQCGLRRGRFSRHGGCSLCCVYYVTLLLLYVLLSLFFRKIPNVTVQKGWIWCQLVVLSDKLMLRTLFPSFCAFC